jgi:hypothetical protein
VRSTTRGLCALVAMLSLAAGLAGCTQNPPTTSPGQAGTKTIRYGPYTVPAATPTKMGMIENSFAFNVEKPCSNCYITTMQAGLVTPDGATANVNNGLWLHHMVLFDTAKQDLTCPGLGVGALGQRFFSSGNERTPVHAEGLYGYKQGANDQWNLIYDLMNMAGTAKQVYVTVTFDFVPASTPGYKEITPVWLDVNQCSVSAVPAKTGQYQYDYSVTAGQNSKLIGIGGHIHDGGTHLGVYKNGQQVCDSIATYGGTPAYIEGPDSLDMPGMGHISQMSRCQGTETNPVTSIKTGDVIKISAFYDSNAHMQMGTEPVMGIAVGYLDVS